MQIHIKRLNTITATTLLAISLKNTSNSTEQNIDNDGTTTTTTTTNNNNDNNNTNNNNKHANTDQTT